MMNDINKNIFYKQHNIYDFIENLDDIEYFNYISDEKLKFKCDYSDSLMKNLTKICKLSNNHINYLN